MVNGLSSFICIIVYMYIIYKHMYVILNPSFKFNYWSMIMQFGFVACMSIVLCRCRIVLAIDLLAMIHLHPLILFIIMFDVFGI